MRLTRRPFLALALAALASPTLPATAAADLLINEVDADQTGTDGAEFVEIYDGGVGGISLTGFVLVFFNGASPTDASYQAFDLDGQVTDGSGYFVLCGNAATVPSCDLDVTPSTDLVQNGADAVALYAGDASSFPPGTPPTTTDLIDALVYDTDDADDAGLLVLLNPGEPQVNENADGTATTESNQRCPSGSGGARNTSTYTQAAPTPGAANCFTPPTLTIGDVSRTEGDAGTTDFVFTVSIVPAPVGTATFDLTVNDGSATVADGDYVDQDAVPGAITGPATTTTFTVAVNGDATAEPHETFTVSVGNLAGAVLGDGTATGTIVNDDGVTVTAIHAVQGSGESSPLAGNAVTVRGLVTGVKSNGFFVQEEDADADADPATSEGILVFTSSTPTVAVGDRVQVTGTVQEFVPAADPEQPPLSELGGTLTIGTMATGQPLPSPVPLTSTFPDPAGAFDQLERLEGMRVSVASLEVGGATLGSLSETLGTVVSNGVFYGVVTGVARARREAGVQRPDDLATLLAPDTPPANIPRFDTNPERLRIDSDAQPGRIPFEARAGALVSGLIGPLDYTFRTYTVLPDSGAVLGSIGGATPTPASAPAAGEITVAAYNFERLFDTVDDPLTDDPVGVTWAWFLARLTKASLHVRDYLRTPDVVGAVEVENLATLIMLAAQISTDAIAAAQPDPQYVAYLVEGNDIGGIDVGFLVKTRPVAGTVARVEVGEVVQERDGTLWTDPSDGLDHTLNDRPPLRLTGVVNHPNGSAFPLTVIVVHQRSLSGISSVATDGSTTVGNRVRRKRRAQAEDLADLIQDRQVAAPAERIVVVGDFNAFEVNDGFVDAMGTVMGTPAPEDQVALASADLVSPDLVRLTDADDYSFVFDGNAQNLDHALANAPLVAATSARRLDHPRINADFAETDQATANARLADHDPLVAYFEVAAFADPGALFRDDFERGDFDRWSGVVAPAP